MANYATHAMSRAIIVDNLLECIIVCNLVTAVFYKDLGHQILCKRLSLRKSFALITVEYA